MQPRLVMMRLWLPKDTPLAPLSFGHPPKCQEHGIWGEGELIGENYAHIAIK